MLRQDKRSADQAKSILRWGNAERDETVAKKTKSGYTLTINDNAVVQAQWPQLNVFRSPSNLGTYDTFSIDEFVSGYRKYVEDCLLYDKPDVNCDLYSIAYLNDRLDEVPLNSWGAVRDAHGEVLRQIEQGRQKWDRVNDRSRAFSKALRMAAVPMLEPAMKAPKRQVQQHTAQEKKPCPDYQSRSCDKPGTHVQDDVVLYHSCATCLRVKGQQYSPPSVECNWRWMAKPGQKTSRGG